MKNTYISTTCFRRAVSQSSGCGSRGLVLLPRWFGRRRLGRVLEGLALRFGAMIRLLYICFRAGETLSGRIFWREWRGIGAGSGRVGGCCRWLETGTGRVEASAAAGYWMLGHGKRPQISELVEQQMLIIPCWLSRESGDVDTISRMNYFRSSILVESWFSRHDSTHFLTI